MKSKFIMVRIACEVKYALRYHNN